MDLICRHICVDDSYPQIVADETVTFIMENVKMSKFSLRPILLTVGYSVILWQFSRVSARPQSLQRLGYLPQVTNLQVIGKR
jgi:hypothetical protein